MDLSPVTTQTVSRSAANGNFCTPQRSPGCFASPTCRAFQETGVPAGSLLPEGTVKPVTLAATFCVPETTSLLINSQSDLPGPGATTLPGTLMIEP